MRKEHPRIENILVIFVVSAVRVLLEARSQPGAGSREQAAAGSGRQTANHIISCVVVGSELAGSWFIFN